MSKVKILIVIFTVLSLVTGAIYVLEKKFKSSNVSYQIYGVNYGNSYYREDRVVKGGNSNEFVSFSWLFWIVKGNGRIILVDTGFKNSNLAQKWNISDYINPIDRLAQLGVSPREVTDVILTHAHWDHIGCVKKYRNATIWIQEKEYNYATTILNSKKSFINGMKEEDIKALQLCKKEERLFLIQGDREIIPGIEVTLDSSHTPGHQYITIETNYGPVIIAGDATYIYENNLELKPIGNAVDYSTNLLAIKEMRKKAVSPYLILPGHGPKVKKLFPEISNGIFNITSNISLEELEKRGRNFKKNEKFITK